MKSRLSLPSTNQPVQDESVNQQRAFWAALIFTFVALASFVFVIFLASRLPVWQMFAITGLTAVALVLDIVGTALIGRGKTMTGLQYLYWSLLFTITPNVLLVTGATPYLMAIVLVIGFVHVFYLQPRSLRKYYQFGPIIAAVFMGIVEFLQPAFRLNINVTNPSSGYFGPVILVFLLISLAFLILRQIWGSTSLSLKMGLLSALLILGMFGIAIGAYVGVQNLEYQLSNIYDFMLVPIVAINRAQAALAASELYISQSQVQDLGATERVRRLENALSNNQAAKEVIDRYNNEWVTTISPDFTRDLRSAGMLSLQQQEVETLHRLNSSFTAYQSAFERYLVSAQFGTVNVEAANQAAASIREVRSDLQNLIKINTAYADFSNTTARNVTKHVTVNNVLVLLVGIIISILASYFIIRSITGRLNDLTRSAAAMQSGDLNQRVTVTGRDEVSLLGSVFNDMAARLRALFGTLEQRVAARTRNLELAAEVGRAVSQVRELNVMLKDACDLILKEFDLYYVQVYLTNPSQTALKLEAGTGTVGAQLLERSHSLPLDTNSINGRAAMEQHTVVIADTTESAVFRKNALLPETRGEMAVPLIVAGKVVGVLDMQSRQANVLTDEVRPAFEALAGQLAVAIQNATLLAETEQARAEVEKQARRLVRAGWNEHLDAIHKPEKIGFLFDHNQVVTVDNTVDPQLYEESKTVSAPISITGESLGTLVVELDHEDAREQTIELVNLVARQVAQQVENLRLLESAERYRYEAEQAVRRQTLEGWRQYMESRSAEKLSYLYDSKEVRTHDQPLDDAFSFALPIKTRDEKIGSLGVQDLTEHNQEAVELVSAVAERLSAHIENLRLLEETKRGQEELNKRAENLAMVSEISSASSRELDIQKLLDTVVHLTQHKFRLYHVHVFTFDESTGDLQVAACGWKEGEEHQGVHNTTKISLSQEQSLVARAARARKPVIVNDVHNEPGWLSNPFLPHTHSEMAVPLIIGDQLLGVLDIQSEKLNAFSQEDASIHTTLAAQIATSIQNAHSFEQSQEALTWQQAINRTSVMIGQAQSIEEIVRSAAELLPLLGMLSCSVSLVTELDANGAPTLSDIHIVRFVNNQFVSMPPVLRQPTAGWLPDEAKYYQENRVTVFPNLDDLTTIVPSTAYKAEGAVAYMRQVGMQSAIALALGVRNKAVGYLTFTSQTPLAHVPEKYIAWLAGLVDLIAAAIDNQDLLEETRRGQEELNKRAQRLASVAEITTVSSREFDVQKMLESVVHLTRQKFGLYHCHVFLYNEQTNRLNIAACGWEQGDIHERIHDTAAISLDKEDSLVARAARTQKAVIVNDVHNEPGWLPNPMLPNTESELAVPLLIGGRLLGVLDVQSERLNAFTDEDANIQTTLASQVATALQNAYSFSQAQSALAQSEKLFDASRRLTQATDLQNLVAETVGTMNIPEVNRALLATFDYDQNGDVEQLTIIGNWWNGTGHEITPIGTRYPREVIRVMSMFVSPVPVFFNDSFTDARVDATTMQLVKRLNLRAVAVLPLHLGTQQIGALILEAEDPHSFTQDEIRLFSALAPQIATVVDNKRQFEKAQRQAERESMLNAIGQKIQSATSVEAVLQIAARELGRALSAPLTVAQLGISTKTAGNNSN